MAAVQKSSLKMPCVKVPLHDWFCDGKFAVNFCSYPDHQNSFNPDFMFLFVFMSLGKLEYFMWNILWVNEPLTMDTW